MTRSNDANWQYEPYAPETIEDPYPSYRRLHDLPAPYYEPKTGSWVLARYEDVKSAGDDPARLSSTLGVSPRQTVYSDTGEVVDVSLRQVEITAPMLILTDPPEHSRLRGVIGELSEAAKLELSGEARRTFGTLLDTVRDRAACDFIDDLARPLATVISAQIAGIPSADVPQVKQWANHLSNPGSMVDVPPPEVMAQADTALHHLENYFGTQADQDPGPCHTGVLGRLLEAQTAGELPRSALLPNVVTFLQAGEEPVTAFLGNLMNVLLDKPEVWHTLSEQPTLIPSVVNEALRYDAPIQQHFRTAVDEVVIGMETVPLGGRVLLLFGAANRDPEHYDRPDDFQPERNPRDHLAFGSGPHSCWGADVARLIGAVLLEELLERKSQMTRAGAPRRGTHPMLRMFAKLPLALRS